MLYIYIYTRCARALIRTAQCRAERSGAEPSGAVCSSLAAGNAQTHASLPRDQTANTVGLPLHCDNSLIARKDTRRVEHTTANPLCQPTRFPLLSMRKRERERGASLSGRERLGESDKRGKKERSGREEGGLHTGREKK